MFKSKQAKQLRVEEAKRDRIEASRKTHEDNKAKWEDEINVAEKKVKRLEDGKTKLERKKIQRETELNELNVTHKELTELEAINDTLNKTARGLNGWSKFFDNLKNKFPIL
jgi:chromosome segregation ATPase